MYFFFTALLGFSVVFALWKGGAPERLCALVFVAMTVIQYIGSQEFGRRFGSVDAVSLIVDVIGFLGFSAIALFADRIWPLCTAAMQAISCASHFGREISIEVEPLVYGVMRSGPTLIALLLLFAGTLRHLQREKRAGFDRSWVPSFRPPTGLPGFLIN